MPTDGDLGPLSDVHVAVITVSDRASAGVRPDITGPLLADAFTDAGAAVTAWTVRDSVDDIAEALTAAIAAGSTCIVTTGGTGVGPRDVTPEATGPFLHQDLPGIPELLRARDAARTPLVALSRGRAGITAAPQRCLVVNLPGSVSAVESALEVLPGLIAHVASQLAGEDH